MAKNFNPIPQSTPVEKKVSGIPVSNTPVSSTPVRNSPIPKPAAKSPMPVPNSPAPAVKPAAVPVNPANSKAMPAGKSAPTTKAITHDDIAKRAYEIHLSGSGGSETDNWHRAERELRGH